MNEIKLNRMEKPTNIKDKAAIAYIDFLENKLQFFTKSPYVNSYLSLKRLVDRGNLQLDQSAEDEIDFESKKFKSMSEFITKQKTYMEQLEYYRSKMNPLDQQELDQEMRKSAGIAEKVAMKNQNAGN